MSLGAQGGERLVRYVLSLMPPCRHIGVPNTWIFIDPSFYAVILAGIRTVGAGILLSRPGAAIVAASTSVSPLSAV